jgi:hypothetical protein
MRDLSSDQVAPDPHPGAPIVDIELDLAAGLDAESTTNL